MKNTILPPLGLPINKSHNLSQGLVGCWMLNEGGGLRARDSTRLNGLDGALSACTFKQSAQGNCVNFNGTTSFINMNTAASYPNLNIPLGLTIIASINTTTVAVGTRDIVADSSAAGTASQYALEINNTAGKLSFLQGNSTRVLSTGTLNANQWYRVGVTRTGNNAIKFYINGVLDRSVTIGVSPSAQQGMAIGRLGNLGALFFSGLINKVYMYNRPLSDTEMMQDYINPLEMFILKKNMLANA